VSGCPACRADLPDGARFCPSCGTRLDPGSPEATERKTVTTLFADIVGFTALGERHDPEDIDVALRGFYALARTIVERFGGVVEKFIGDAVVGLFGVPLAHEDDAERAVRAALELVAHMRELPPLADERLQVRCAVNSGASLVRLNARPEAGEGVLVGDAVNTCARLLAEAPAMGVVAGEMTQRLSAQAIAYERLPSRAAKGKSKPVARWLARGPIARREADSAVRDATRMVGREVELAILLGLLERAIASNAPQFALVVGEAGIGKTRLVREFFQMVDQRDDFLCTWRQGRSAPYGAGLALQPLREIVAAHAGILHTDSPLAVEEKLDRALGGAGQDPWYRDQIRPLAGLPSAGLDRQSSHVAWRRFIESMARPRPAIVVFEDVHWASDATLRFLEHLARSSGGVPLLVILTARPEFLDAFDSAGAGFTRLDMRSLNKGESSRLALGLAGDLSVATAGLAAEQSGGNPLFIEEFLRFARIESRADQGMPQGRREGELDAPETIIHLISARLDALPRDHRSLLCDAAVVGQVFWPDVLSRVGKLDPSVVSAILGDLEEREFIRRQDASSMAGAPEFRFWHGMTRQVAYERLPRIGRATRHAAAARWMQEVEADASADFTQLAAYHYLTAVDLAEAANDPGLGRSLTPAAIDALGLAGEQTMVLDVQTAESQLARAVQLAAGDPDRHPTALVRWASALRQKGALREAADVLDEAISEFTDMGDLQAADDAAFARWYAHWLLADGEADAYEPTGIGEGAAPSPELVNVLSALASRALYAGRDQEGLALLDRAFALCEELDLPEPLDSLSMRGAARCDLGDIGGLDDHRRALELAEARGAHHLRCSFYANLGEYTNPFKGPRAALTLHDAGLDLARDRHDEIAECFTRSLRLLDLVLLGEWDACVAEVPDLDAYLESREDIWDLQLVRATAGLLYVWRGDAWSADAITAWAVKRSERSHIASTRFTCLVSRASTVEAMLRRDEACALLDEAATLRHAAKMCDAALRMPEVVRLSVCLGRLDQVQVLGAELPESRPFDKGTHATIDAHVAEQQGDAEGAARAFAAAQTGFEQLGIPYESAQAALGRARCLAAAGLTREAATVASAARLTFAALGARPALSAVGALLSDLEGQGTSSVVSPAPRG
jgi:class 3 adenylate cyclase